MVDDEEHYLVHLRARGLRPNTIAQAARVLRWFREQTGVDPIDATPHDLELFLVRREHLPTRAVEWSYLSMFYKWAIRFDRLDRNPLDRVDRPRVPRRRPRPMPVDDLAKILRTSPDRLKPWFLLAAYCGLRACDIAPMRREHLQQEAGWLYIPETKGGHERRVPVPEIVEDALTGLPDDGYMFRPRSTKKTGHVTAHLVSVLSNNHLRQLGARQTFHGLRHWYGTQALRAAGGNLRVVQEMLGHQRIASTELYTDVNADEMTAAAARLPIVA